MELDYEGMCDLLHDVSLDLRVGELVRLYDEVLLQGLDGIDFVIILFPGHVDFTERTATDDFQKLEVIDCNIIAFRHNHMVFIFTSIGR